MLRFPVAEAAPADLPYTTIPLTIIITPTLLVTISPRQTGFETTIRNKLSAWYPQLNLNYSLQHNFQVPTSVIGGNPIRLGVNNTSAAQFTVSQNLFNRDALLAFRSKGDVRTQARQHTGIDKIGEISNVSKAFYDVLATMQQIKVSDENIARLESSIRIATNQYKARTDRQNRL